MRLSGKFMLHEDFLDLVKDLFWLDFRIDVVIFIELAKILDYFLGFVLVSYKPLFNTLDIIVTSSTRLSTFKQSVCHDFLTTLQVQNKRHVNFFIHQLFPFWKVLHISWESIDQETTSLETWFAHSLIE